MRRLTKALIAAGAGTALFIGGQGTLAAWSGTQNLTGFAPISAGALEVRAAAAGVWKDQTGATLNLAAFHIAPGDTLTYTTTIGLTATGDNLHGRITLSPSSIAPVNAGSAADAALASILTTSATYTVDGVTGPAFTARPGTQTIAVSVTLTWPSGAASTDNTATNGRVSLANLSLTATQN